MAKLTEDEIANVVIETEYFGPEYWGEDGKL